MLDGSTRSTECSLFLLVIRKVASPPPPFFFFCDLTEIHEIYLAVTTPSPGKSAATRPKQIFLLGALRCSMAGNFTFPTEAERRFRVADLVNITWDVVAPLISLYETCGSNDRAIEERTTNKYSYVWIATRKNYVESGCSFVLQPFTTEGESYGDNITSILFGVSKRYTDDPSPVSYNFINASSSTSTSATKATSTSLSTSASVEPISTPTTTSTPKSSHGMSKTSKIGIGIGVPLGVLLVALAMGALIFYRRKCRQKETQGVPTNQQNDELAPLPMIWYKEPHNTRLSQTETVASSFSNLSNNNQRSEGTGRRLSELMSTERVEIG
ncbi:unnamed protein product [Penicillium nalgiovense]|nr:unnamed protein product [Penicillium nalgiovense]